MKMMRYGKLFARVALLGVSLLFLVPASAQLVDATCLGNVDLQFNPPLKLLQEPTTVTGSGSATCLFSEDLSSHTASLADIVGSGNLSCLVNTGAAGSAVVNWDNQPQSVVNWQSVQVELFDIELGLPSVPRVFVLEGEVVSGTFQGSTMVISYNDIPTLAYLDCLFGGLGEISGPVSMTFTQPPI